MIKISGKPFIGLVILLNVLSGCASPQFNPLFFPDLQLPQTEAKRSFLGISMVTVPDTYLSDKVKKDASVFIKAVIPETPAKEAGIIAGDIVIAADGKSFNEEGIQPLRQLKKAIRGKNIGDELELSIFREGTPLTVVAKLREEKKIPPKVKAQPEIENLQKSMGESDSVIYQLLQASGKVDDFLNTISVLRGKSQLVDSYKISVTENPFRLSEMNYLLQNPTNIIPVSRRITKSFVECLNAGHYDLGCLISVASLGLDVELSLSHREDPPHIDSIDDFIGYVIAKISRAESFRNMAFKELSADDITFLVEVSSKVLSSNVTSEDNLNLESEERLLKTAAKIDYPMLFKSMAEASEIISPEIIQALGELDIKDFKKHRNISADIAEGDIIDMIETEFGRIMIGGPGRTHYKGDSFMVIDLGGDDIYENNAGASTPELHFSISIDLSGDDKYITKANLSQGRGLLGTGILADIKGNDLYIGARYSQGSGIFGGGILLDLDGDDRFIAESLSQGAGIFGIGMLINIGGNDIYEARLSSQGFAHVKGFGVLIDISGDDFYLAGGKYPDHRDPEHSTKSLSQGFAIGIRPFVSPIGASGGIGALIDMQGNDYYIGDYFAQGSSYWYSLGILHDMNGDDTYIAGRYAQGAGVHTSAGTLIDEDGNDSYIVTFGVSQGMGYDFGIGVLADIHGDNSYQGGILSGGAATCGGIGILYDRDSLDNLIRERSWDTGTPDDSCGAYGFGILMNDKSGRIIQSVE